MDVCKSELAFRKHPTTAVETTPRPPLVPAERSNVVTTTSSTAPHRTREVPSRYKSPSPASGPRRCASPTLTRTTSTTTSTTTTTGQPNSAPKRSQSADRRRPSTPPSPISPCTPAAEARRSAGGRVPESLWPSTMRSLSVSFQSDSISIPVIKKEKPPAAAAASSAGGGALSERTLRPSSNVAPRKPTTPERKRSPLKGKNVPGQSENSRPLDGPHTARLIDQHRWPSRAGSRTISSNPLTRSVDLGPRSLSGATTTTTPKIKPLQKSSSESSSRLLSSLEEGVVTSRSMSRPASPSKPSSMTSSMMMSSSFTRGLSPSRGRPSTPPAGSRGVSPSRTATNQTANPNSVLSFIADFKKTKKGSSYIEDAHQLRLMYNRNLQWRFANARSRRVLYVQKVTAERTLFNVWSETLSLWDSVIQKRINLQQMKLDLKLNSVLNDQMDYLDDWALVERDHIGSLSGAVEDLEASTLRLPVTGGARADIDSLKVAICLAVDVMQAMASSTCSMLPRVERMNSLVSELAIVAAREKAMLNECEALLASTEAMQAEEYSLRTHLIQIKEDLGNLSSQFWQSRHQH